jgi:hypothetical protein
VLPFIRSGRCALVKHVTVLTLLLRECDPGIGQNWDGDAKHYGVLFLPFSDFFLKILIVILQFLQKVSPPLIHLFSFCLHSLLNRS